MGTEITRLKRQQIGITKWVNSGYRGILHYPMRFGKTICGLLAHKLQYELKPTSHTIVLTTSSIITSQWDKIIKEIVQSDRRDTISVLSIGSVQQTYNMSKVPLNCDLLIVDECHKFLTNERVIYINGTRIKYEKILMLTGTLPDSEKRDELISIAPIVDTISEEEAIHNNWIAPMIEYNVPLELSYDNQVRYEEYSKIIRGVLQIFKGSEKVFPSFCESSFDVITACYRGATYKLLGIPYNIKAKDIRMKLAKTMGWSKDIDITTNYGYSRDRYWNPNNIYDNVKLFMESIKKRNDILINNTQKLEAVIQILDTYFPTTICFNESTTFADIISSTVNKHFAKGLSVCYHSNIKSKHLIDRNGNTITYVSGKNAGKPKMFGKQSLKQLAIKGMNSGHYKLLCTARALDEGLNIPPIEMVITTAGTTNPIQYKQRSARGRTVDVYNPNKVTLIINLYFNDFNYTIRENDKEKRINVTSRDKEKLLIRQKDSKNVITLKNLQELTKIIENKGQNT